MLTWDYLRDRLIHEYEKMQRGSAGIVESVENPQDALLSQKFMHRKKANEEKRFKCYYCKKAEHFAKNCYKRKADSKGFTTKILQTKLKVLKTRM